MKASSILALGAALAFSANSAASGQASDQSTPPATKQAADPNRPVCQKVEVIGSRLATKRICMSHAQWLELQRHDREETEKMQTQRPCNGEMPTTTQC